jgi:prevent-host-death family protein
MRLICSNDGNDVNPLLTNRIDVELHLIAGGPHQIDAAALGRVHLVLGKDTEMAKEKILSIVKTRSKLSEIVDRVAENGDTYVVSKRRKPVAVIIGIDRYRELSGTSKYLKDVGGKKIFKLGGIGKATGDIDEAIRELRKSRIQAVIKSFP